MIASSEAGANRGDDGVYEARARRARAGLLAELAAALGAARRARGMRQADVAAAMGTSQSCVSDFERAKTNPQLSFVARYAEAVGAQLRIAVSDGGSELLVPGSSSEDGQP